MLEFVFAKPRHRRRAADAAQADRSSTISPAARPDDDLPLIVARAQEDARSRTALERMGYFRVRFAYLRHRRDHSETFHALSAEHLWPTMDFVRDWLRVERRRLVARNRRPFLLALLATVASGLALFGALAIFG